MEGLDSETLQEMLQAAFAATSIGVIFDATLLIGISLGLKKALWPVVVAFTVIASMIAYFAAGDVVAAFCIGVFAAAVNILNIPHITTPFPKTSTTTPAKPQWIIIPLVWVLLGISVILQELKILSPRWNYFQRAVHAFRRRVHDVVDVDACQRRRSDHRRPLHGR